MLHQIQILPIEIANQIAAGEVIERPASVVKELLENSIDAGATEIEIDIEQDGTHLIRVRDNGVGISQEDLLLAITQHATSKIRELTDLNQLTSLGFRGEALASVSAISEFTLISRTQESDTAWQLELSATQRTPQMKPAAHPVGTTIEVRNLFFNTPVRRKFLKAERTEFQHIEEVVRQIVLSAPQLGLILRHHHRTILQIKAAHNVAEQGVRAGKILGRNFLQKAIYLDIQNGDLQLRGWILPEEESRAHSDQQYFFLNGRVLRDKLILHAIRVACDTIFASGRYPAYVLFFSCDLDKVDVNVHPTKHEVRFVQPRLIHDFIEHSLYRTLHEPHPLDVPSRNLSNDDLFVSDSDCIKEAANEYHYMSTDSMLGKFIGIVQKKFLLLESVNGLVIIDYMAAQNFLHHRQIEMALKKNSLKSQPSLFPEAVKLSAVEMGIVTEREVILQHYGITLQNIAPDLVLIRGLPHWLRMSKGELLLHDLLASPIEKMVAIIAKHSITQEKQTTAQWEEFVMQLSEYPNSLLQETKLIKFLSEQQLAEWFK